MSLDPGWTLTASAFSWTPEVIRAEQTADAIAVSIIESGIASVIEVEAGQVWRGFPEPSDAAVDLLREQMASAGGRVAVVGGSIDEWSSASTRRSEDERLAFLLPQLRAAHRLGATGLRVPFGQPGRTLLERLQPTAQELDVVLYQEIQGQQGVASDRDRRTLDDLAELDCPQLRVLVDTSMFMPALPLTYLEQLDRGGVEAGLLRRLAEEWSDPATGGAVLAALRDGTVPGGIHTLFMNLLVRFGRSPVSDMAQLLPLTGALHLKLWDLEDLDDRVSTPLREVGEQLRAHRFAGTLTSEWGGHEWLDLPAEQVTRSHLALVRDQLSR